MRSKVPTDTVLKSAGLHLWVSITIFEASNLTAKLGQTYDRKPKRLLIGEHSRDRSPRNTTNPCLVMQKQQKHTQLTTTHISTIPLTTLHKSWAFAMPATIACLRKTLPESLVRHSMTIIRTHVPTIRMWKKYVYGDLETFLKRSISEYCKLRSKISRKRNLVG